jgi:Domain of unknown function (DUF1854)
VNVSTNATGAPEHHEAPFDLSVDAWGRLVLTDSSGRRHEGVDPVRAFPMTAPGHWISIVNAQGHEIILIKDMSSLSESLRGILEEQLARREFVPEIRRVVSVSGDSSPCEWRVETDRGPAEFIVDSDEGIRRLGPTRIVITDARGMRFQVLDLRALDAASRRRLERYL